MPMGSAEVYNDLFKRLPQFDISYISKLGHGSYKIRSSWKDLVPEIIDYFEANIRNPFGQWPFFWCRNISICRRAKADLLKE